MTARADDGLVLRAERGDRDARAALVRRHLRQVWGLALYQAGDPVEAARITKEVFLRVFRELPRLPDQRKLRVWIHGIAVDVIRKTRPAEGAKRTAAREEAALEGLRSLPENIRKPLVLRYFEVLPYSKMSSRLGSSREGIDQLLRRAKQLIRRPRKT